MSPKNTIRCAAALFATPFIAFAWFGVATDRAPPLIEFTMCVLVFTPVIPAVFLVARSSRVAAIILVIESTLIAVVWLGFLYQAVAPWRSIHIRDGLLAFALVIYWPAELVLTFKAYQATRVIQREKKYGATDMASVFE